MATVSVVFHNSADVSQPALDWAALRVNHHGQN
jgi:hypothetical protein